VRGREEKFADYGHGVVYAEECFEGIVDFPPNRSAVVRNKYQAPATVVPAPAFGDPEMPLLVFTGTIAENWGVIRAVELWQSLQRFIPVRLAMAGHSHDRALLAKITEMVRNSGFSERFLLVGGQEYVPYESIVGWMEAADAGLALYRLLPNIRDRIPTKFYEFMAAGKPLIYPENPAWTAAIQPESLRFPLSWPPDEEKLRELAKLISKARSGSGRAPSPPRAWSWHAEAENMLALIRAILGQP
jgi:glycosyltransferase involved in cell wall biosynthesis